MTHLENALIVGSGAREHAMASALVRNSDIELHAAMAVDNPGIARISESVTRTESDAGAIIEQCRKHRVQFSLIGPEKPLEQGLTNALVEAGIPCASPTREAARIETNKGFMRTLMRRYGIPGSVDALETSLLSEAMEFCERHHWQVAVKPIGLTSGKGVKVWGDHLHSQGEVTQYISHVLKTRMSGYDEVLIEELLHGQEFTVHFFSDGTTALPSPAVQDHKRAFDGGQGPNTGGMGSYSDANGLLPFLSREDYETAVSIGNKIVTAMKQEGVPFKGVLYGQFMLTSQGPKVVEINARFGDPEAINTLMVLQSSYADLCRAIIAEELSAETVRFAPRAIVARYIVPKGYGVSPQAGAEVQVNEHKIRAAGAELFYASCDLKGSANGITTVQTTTSRTLAIAASGSTIQEAQERTAKAMKHVSGDVYYRRDIASEDSIRAKVEHMFQLRSN
ncbi:MAG: phosphoribosylamine--glycine ligase [Candidatus Peribacteraceae bacterium]|nr:phosphoribosylamine--glycine ligase [Candidatus Peribacteraceae bacterium]MDD5074684.1 phosphoribosylamine--glycine ligase [Candidatus Peribacteraceae bacterium]